MYERGGLKNRLDHYKLWAARRESQFDTLGWCVMDDVWWSDDLYRLNNQAVHYANPQRKQPTDSGDKNVSEAIPPMAPRAYDDLLPRTGLDALLQHLVLIIE